MKKPIILNKPCYLDVGSLSPIKVVPLEFELHSVICKYINVPNRIDHISYKVFEVNGYSKFAYVNIKEAYPPKLQKVIVIVEKNKYNGEKTYFKSLARYVPYMTIKEDDFMMEEFYAQGDYSEDEDEFYTPEGFYEWSYEAEIHYRISDPVIAWMYVPEF